MSGHFGTRIKTKRFCDIATRWYGDMRLWGFSGAFGFLGLLRFEEKKPVTHPDWLIKPTAEDQGPGYDERLHFPCESSPRTS